MVAVTLRKVSLCVEGFAVLFSLLFGAMAARAQNPDTMRPEESTAKAKQLLQQLITAMGGQRYLNIKESDCEGRLAKFGHGDELMGYINFANKERYPDQDRVEYTAKGHNGLLKYLAGIDDDPTISHGGTVVMVYNGDEGWTVDKSGVSELSPVSVAGFQEQSKRDIHNLLRLRLDEPGMTFRYAGPDVVDLKPVDLVEVVDTEQRDFKLAVDRSTHLLVRSWVAVGDEASHDRSVASDIYSNFQPMDGVKTALQITHYQDNRKLTQVFFTSCKYNPGFPEEIFSKNGLSKRTVEEVAKKAKEKEKAEN
jgi:hypothetical protein